MEKRTQAKFCTHHGRLTKIFVAVIGNERVFYTEPHLQDKVFWTLFSVI